MKKIVVVGRFPAKNIRLEGMLQRIKNIDEKIIDADRTYLNLYAFKNFKFLNFSFGKARVITTSFLRFRKIYSVLNEADVIYIHSIYFYALVVLPFFFTGKGKKIILDVHGAVPEELLSINKKLLAFFMAWVEKKAFDKINVAICVSKKMQLFYEAKYKNNLVEYKYVPVFTSKVCTDVEISEKKKLLSYLGWGDNDVVFVYSGGLQEWQNIEKILAAIKSMLSIDVNYKFLLLTGEVDLLMKMVDSLFDNNEKNRIIISHVNPSELAVYYAISHYGFILREDHVLNRVANPTKMIEYLYFGLTPIVLSEEIGDFLDFGYDYVKIQDISVCKFKKIKSEKNKMIAKSIMNFYNKINFNNILNID